MALLLVRLAVPTLLFFTITDVTLISSLVCLHTRLWEEELNFAREGPAVVQLEEGSILVLGGRGFEAQGSVEKWTGRGWDLKPEMKLMHSDQEYCVVLIDI